MKKILYSLVTIILVFFSREKILGQSGPTNHYCTVGYTSGQCNQPNPSNTPGNFVNDFINDFTTCGANNDIVNTNSGCNGMPNNYIYYGSTYTLIVAPNQLITCHLRSGITYGQGFAIFVDWNQNSLFDLPSEQMASTTAVPTANTWTTLTFSIPNAQPVGAYRMRVRCSFATITPPPCGNQTYGETEDYDLVVVNYNSATVLTGTATSNSPICSGQTLSLSVVTSPTTNAVAWSGPNSFTSAANTVLLANATSSLNGVYTVTLGTGGCPFVTTVSAVVAPSSNFTIGPLATTICQGGNFIATTTVAANANQLSFSWGPPATGIFNPTSQSTTIVPPLVPLNVPVATLIYSVVVTPTVQNCPTMHTLAVTINNPLTPTLTMPGPLCDIFAAVQLTASPVGGIWGGNPAVSANGSFNPGLAVISPTNPTGSTTVSYSVSAGNCIVSNTGTLHVSKYHTPALSSSITLSCVQDPAFNLMNIVQYTTNGYWSGIHVFNNYFNSGSPTPLSSGTYTLTHYTFSTPDSTACKDSLNFVVPVFNPPIPVINPIVQVCDNTPTIALTANPPNGVWSGASGISPSGILTPSLSPVNNTLVVYTAGQGTCVASSSKTFQVSQYNPATLTGTVQNLCDNTNPVNLMSIVQNTNGSWSGTGIYITPPNVFNPANLSSQPISIYTLTYNTHSTPNQTLCPASQTLAVSVLTRITPTITSAGPFCTADSPIQLTVTPAIGSWIASPYLTSGGLFTPSLSIVGNSYIQYVIGTSTCNAAQTKIIQIEAFVPATILSQLDVQCITSPPINLTPYTQNNLGSWSGTGLTGSTFNPGVAGSGNYTLTYHTASSPSGLCPSHATLAVQVFSLAAPIITTLSTMCNNALPLQLQVSPVGGLFSNPLPGVVSIGGLFNPAFAAIGDNYINYTIAVGPCKSDTHTKITIEKFISADFEKLPDLVYCRNQLPFNLNSFAENPGGEWSNIQGSSVSGSMFDPFKATIGDGNIIRYTTYSSAENKLLCPDVSTLQIRVKDITPVKPVLTSNGNCLPVQIVLNTPSTNEGQWLWSITDGSECSGLGATHIFTTSGTYTVLLTYIDAEAKSCSTQVVLPPITINPSPKADFSVPPGEISISEPLVTLTNLSTIYSENKYVWAIQGHDTAYDFNPKVKFTQAGSYKITLTAKNLYGCKDESSKIIDVKNDFNVQIPNSFTPNFDGLNDVFVPVFTPYGLDTKTFEMEIFDRWGRQVYHSWDVTKGWDGTVGGDVAKEDSYVYRIRFKDLDGRVYSKTGHLTLLKN